MISLKFREDENENLLLYSFSLYEKSQNLFVRNFLKSLWRVFTFLNQKNDTQLNIKGQKLNMNWKIKYILSELKTLSFTNST